MPNKGTFSILGFSLLNSLCYVDLVLISELGNRSRVKLLRAFRWAYSAVTHYKSTVNIRYFQGQTHWHFAQRPFRNSKPFRKNKTESPPVGGTASSQIGLIYTYTGIYIDGKV